MSRNPFQPDGDYNTVEMEYIDYEVHKMMYGKTKPIKCPKCGCKETIQKMGGKICAKCRYLVKPN